mgnify:CR=1 FL=1
MAYKFQLGAFTASGSIKAEEGFDANDQNIMNVGTLKLDTLQSDGNELDIALANNQASALEIKEGSNVYQKFVTTTDSEAIEFLKKTDFGTQISLNMNIDTGDIASAVVVNKSPVVNFNSGDVQGSITLTNLASGTGALTIQAASVETAMLNNNIISGQDELAHADIADEDELMVSDGGTLKRVGLDSLQNHYFGKVSGDATVADGGALTIAAGAVEEGMLNDNVISGQAELAHADIADEDELMVSDGGTLKRVGLDSLQNHYFGKISGDATVADGGALTIANDAVEQAMIADDAVGADQLASDAVVNASVASNAAIALSKINTNVDMGGAFTIGSQSDDVATFSGGLIVAGDLTVQGSTTTVDSTTINISSSFTFEGPADDHETVLSCATPGADTTLNLPTLSAGTYFIPAIAGAATDASAAVTAAEFALLDGGSTVANTTLVAGDGFLHNDGGVMKQTKIDELGLYMADGAGIQSSPQGKLSINVDGLSELSAAPHATEDQFIVSDGGIERRVSMTNVANGAFALVSGDVLIASGGAATIQSSAVEGSMLNNNIVSGLDDIGADIVGTDEMIVSDAGTIKRTDMSRLKTFIGAGTAAMTAVGDANATLAIGINAPSAAASAPRTWTLPASADLSVGESIVIKAYGNAATHPLTIAQAGSQEIDGSTANLVLESDNAAITLYYVAADTFIIV